MKLYNMAIRNLKRNKKRSILSIIATSIATFAIVFLFAFIGGLAKDMKDIAINYVTGEVQVRHIDFDENSFSLDRAIDNYTEVVNLLQQAFPQALFSPRIKFPATVFDKADYDKSYMSFGVGVDFTSEESYLGLTDKIIEGAMPKGAREVIMGYGLAKELNLKVGETFTPITSTRRGASTGITFTISALAQFSDSAFTNKTFIVSLEELPRMLKMEDAVSDILIKGFEDQDLATVESEIQRLLASRGFDRLGTVSWINSGSYNYVKMAEGIYGIIAFFFFFMASSVIANTMLMVVFERRKEIGTITAMGMTSREVIRLFFTEAFCLGLVGATVGVILGIVVIFPLSMIGIDLSSMAGEVDFGASFNIFPQLNMKSTVMVFFYSIFIASIVSFFPSRGASKVDPVVALRSE